jgi:hypothetical protein
MSKDLGFKVFTQKYDIFTLNTSALQSLPHTVIPAPPRITAIHEGLATVIALANRKPLTSHCASQR